jgi:hypothetical protein
MTAETLTGPSPAASGRPAKRTWLRRLEAFWRLRRTIARDYLELTRADERLLYDLGIDPLDIRDALNGHPGPAAWLEPVRRPRGRKMR